MKRVYVFAALLLLSLPRSAVAQFFVSPFVDTTLSSPTGNGSSSKAGVGVDFGKFGKLVGLETEVAYHPQILDNAANGVEKSHVWTFSESLLVGPTIARVKPYGVIGGGNLHLKTASAVPTITSLQGSPAVPGLEEVSNNYFTIDLGGGVAYFINKGVGVRGDLRYFHAYGLNLDDLAGLTFHRFDFWRAGVGATFVF